MQNDNIFTVYDIYEDDYGCEGIPDDGEPTVLLVLLNAKGEKLRVKMPDAEAMRQNIIAGSSVALCKNGKIKKLN